MLVNNAGAIKHGQSRETCNIGHTRHNTKASKAKTQHNMCLILLVSCSLIFTFYHFP